MMQRRSEETFNNFSTLAMNALSDFHKKKKANLNRYKLCQKETVLVHFICGVCLPLYKSHWIPRVAFHITYKQPHPHPSSTCGFWVYLHLGVKVLTTLFIFWMSFLSKKKKSYKLLKHYK